MTACHLEWQSLFPAMDVPLSVDRKVWRSLKNSSLRYRLLRNVQEPISRNNYKSNL
ncbi:hypothetical protein H6H01_11810 [Nostoc calcicola FACHB-3891]|nr:hypothetical protein [Nostoc calcicola FACHB-3891]